MLKRRLYLQIYFGVVLIGLLIMLVDRRPMEGNGDARSREG